MYIRAVEAPATYPVSLAEQKKFNRIPDSITDDDALVSVQIAAAVAYAERVTGRSLTSRRYVATFDQFPQFPFAGNTFYPLFANFPFLAGTGPVMNYPTVSPLQETDRLPFTIALKPTPVTSIEKVTYIDLVGNATTLEPGTDFAVDLVSDPVRIAPLPGGRWPQGLIGLSYVQVLFTSGYSADPAATADVVIPAGNPPKQNTEFKFFTGFPQDLKAAIMIVANDLYNNREVNVQGTVGRIPTVDDILALHTRHDFTVDK